jgi:site-specific DNA recombinase
MIGLLFSSLSFLYPLGAMFTCLPSFIALRIPAKEIDANEYREIKEEYEGEIVKIEREIEKISALDSDLKEQILFCCDLLERLPKYFVEADLTAKQQILGSILAEKLVFEENKYRTIKLRGIVSLICRPPKDFKENVNKKSSENSELSNLVPGTGFEQKQFD